MSNNQGERENLSVFKNIRWVFSLVGTFIALLTWTVFLFFVTIFESVIGYKRRATTDKSLFWKRVHACLVEFHGFSTERADKAIKQEKYNQLIYHYQPFDVANAIAGFEVELSQQDWKERYLKKIMGMES